MDQHDGLHQTIGECTVYGPKNIHNIYHITTTHSLQYHNFFIRDKMFPQRCTSQIRRLFWFSNDNSVVPALWFHAAELTTTSTLLNTCTTSLITCIFSQTLVSDVEYPLAYAHCNKNQLTLAACRPPDTACIAVLAMTIIYTTLQETFCRVWWNFYF